MEISKTQIKEVLDQNPDIRLVVITSPTYEGVISNIKEISDIVHKYNIPLMVDEAHGAHLRFMDKLKEYEAMISGADIVVQSLHKTLPALTQCAIMHIQGNIVLEEKVENALDIFETSSPSYILMSSIDECLDIVENEKLFEQYNNNLKYFYNKAKKLKKLQILKDYINQIVIEEKNKSKINYDDGKIVIITEGTSINGKQLADILRFKYHIEVEMENVNYIIAMTSICDKYENFERLIEALIEIDEKLEFKEENKSTEQIKIPERKLLSNEIDKNNGYNFVNYKDAIGKVSKEYIWIYPPGIPIIVPGEIISGEIIEKIENILKTDIDIKTSLKRFPYIDIL